MHSILLNQSLDLTKCRADTCKGHGLALNTIVLFQQLDLMILKIFFQHKWSYDSMILTLPSIAIISIRYERTKFLIILPVFPFEKRTLLSINLKVKEILCIILLLYWLCFFPPKHSYCAWKFCMFFQVQHLSKWKHSLLSTKIILVFIPFIKSVCS